ncbi:TonB-dependent receptor [Qipengyuania sp. GH29]|nr:TonB-dependent receptor [Qipengyuania sphaerica]MBX7541719.1 TonB-dependent receptor [Qipengyuania sphaerica]
MAQDSTEDALADIIAAQDEQIEEDAGPEATGAIILPGIRAQTITVTANGLGTDIRNTGQAVTVLQSDEIENVQGADPTRALRRTPGLSLSRNGGTGGFTGVNIRGANAEQVLVLVDGVRVSDPASPAGGFDFGNLLTGTMGKFDILRGSNSTIWGSDAVGGVIDISTRAETGMRGSVEYGARDTLFASVGAGVDDDGVYYGLTGSWFSTDGFSAAASGTEPDGFRQFALGMVTFVDLTDRLEAFAHANFSEGDLEIDGFSISPPYGLVDSDDTQKTTRHWGDIGLAWYGNDLTLRASYSLADTERVNRNGAGAETFVSDGHSERLALRGEYRLLGGLVAAFGGEHEWSDYVTSFDAPADTSTSGAYAQLGWVLGPLAVHVGGRIDDHEDFGTEATFGGDLSYQFRRDWRVRASLGEGYKAPTLYQLYSDYGNEALVPEHSASFDLGIERGQRGSGLHLALTGFRRESEDLIGYTSCFSASPPALCEDGRFGFYENTGRARAQGIEAEAGYDLTDGLRLSGVYSFVDAEDRESGNDLARRPRHFGTLFADWQSDFGLGLGADLRIVGSSYDDNGNFTRLGGYEVLDVRATQEVGDHLEVFGRIENVLDADYQTVAGYGTAGRGVFAGVRARM